jgi:4-carboxymuconolactone decarboxylase
MTSKVAAAALFVVAFAMPGSAQDRMPPLAPEQMTDAQKKAAAEFSEVRKGGPFGPFAPLLRSPEVMNRARAMGDYLRFRSVLPPRLSEFAILITARHWTQHYEWDAHRPLAVRGGLSEDIVKALAAGRRPDRMTDDEDALYTFLTELLKTQHVGDATYGRAVARFGEQGVIDLIGLGGYYSMLAMVMNTARTPLPAGHQPEMATLPR